jgi:UDP-glucose 4-epimerase
MKVLITGGAGFIGSHLAEKLLKSGYQVRILDNLSSGSLENLSKIINKIEFVRGDCTNPQDVVNSVKDIDVVFHLAANPEVRLELCDTETCFKENVYATYVILEAVRKSNVEVLAFTSSSVVYGEAKVTPTPEDYLPEPISIYGASKLASESLIIAYAHTYRFKALIYRLANIIGPRTKHGVIYDFMLKLRRDSTQLEILGDGKQNKSYLYIDDCVNVIMLGLRKTKRPVEIFNVGSEDQITVKEIAEIVVGQIDLQNVKFKFTGGVNRGRGWEGDVKNMLLDVKKLKSIGWKPKLNSKEAVKTTMRMLATHDNC